MKLCRICLSRDVRLYPMSNYGLEAPFHLLTGMPVDIDKRLPQCVCAECGLRIMSYNKLRQKSLRSHQVLTALLSRFECIINDDVNLTPETIESRLSQTEIVVSHYDPNIDEESGFLTHDLPLRTQFKKEDSVSFSDTKQENELTYSQNDFDASFDKDYFTSNDEEVSLSTLLKASKLKTKIAKESTRHKDTKLDRSNDRPNISHKHRIKVKKKDPETINRKQLDKKENESKKRMNNKEDGHGKDRRMNEFPFETMFTVTKMTTEELKSEILNRKMSSNYLNAAFQCTDCFKGFCDEETFDRHRLRHSQDWGSLECDICKNHYPSKKVLSRHFSLMHSLRYTCRKCTFVTSSRGPAIRHGNKHMGKKYQCKNCEMEYVNYTTYLNHLRTRHASEFVCEMCGHSFISALGVAYHKKIIHRDAVCSTLAGPHCTVCDIKFATEEAYAKHFKFSSKHINKHYDVKQKRPNQGIKQTTYCEQCDLKLDSQLAYSKHFKSAHPDKKRTQVQYSYSFMCDECGKISKSNAALEEHKRIHRKEKPFACARCGRAFTQRIALKMHETTHDENRTLYPCQLCDKRFTNRNNLKRHVFLHSGARPYECENCGKTFKTKSDKQTHYEYVHLKKPWPKRDRHRRVVGGRSGTDIQQ